MNIYSAENTYSPSGMNCYAFHSVLQVAIGQMAKRKLKVEVLENEDELPPAVCYFPTGPEGLTPDHIQTVRAFGHAESAHFVVVKDQVRILVDLKWRVKRENICVLVVLWDIGTQGSSTRVLQALAC